MKLPFQLNVEQSKAQTGIRAWAQRLPGMGYTGNNPARVAIIRGYAGTGKTTIVTSVLEPLQYKIHGEIQFTAPTHAAAEVLSQFTEAHGYDSAGTLHSLLGLQLGVDLEDFTPMNPKFRQSRDGARMAHDGLVVCDEGSMVNAELFKLIIAEARRRNTGVIFMGDPGQLPPIGEENVGSQTLLEANADRGAFFELTQVMRTSNTNPLLDLYTRMRDSLEAEPGSSFEHVSRMNGSEGYTFTRDQGVWATRAYLALRAARDAARPDLVARIGAATNHAIDRYNGLRAKVYEDLNAKAFNVVPGELLVGRQTLYGSPGEDAIIRNSMYYRVVERGPKESDQDIEFERVVLRPMMRRLEEDRDNDIADREIRLVTPQGMGNYGVELNRRLQDGLADRSMWAAYYRFQRKWVTRLPTPMPGRKPAMPTLGYGLATTIHKLQGASIREVYVDADSIVSFGQSAVPPASAATRNRMLYVAASRAREATHFFSSRAS